MNHALLGICLGITFFLVATTSSTPIPPILERLKFYTDLLVKVAPPYVWGGNWGVLGGDCSGQTQAIFTLSGLKLPRLTSLAMWNGGWPGMRYSIAEGAREECDFPHLIFFTWERPAQHVGIVRWNKLADKKRQIMFAEASSNKKTYYYKETLIKQGDNRWNHTAGILAVDLTPGFKTR